MKKLIAFLIASIFGGILFHIGRKTFPDQQIEFCVLSISLAMIYIIYAVYIVNMDETENSRESVKKWKQKRKARKESVSAVATELEVGKTSEEKELTATELARRNGEKILSYCREHNYHLLSDRKHSLNIPSWAQENIHLLVQQQEERTLKTNDGIYWGSSAYFAIYKHEIKIDVVYQVKDLYEDQHLYIDLTEDSELAATLSPFVVNNWRWIKEWLKEPEELLQKCLTFKAEK